MMGWLFENGFEVELGVERGVFLLLIVDTGTTDGELMTALEATDQEVDEGFHGW